MYVFTVRHSETHPVLDCSQTREICEKREECFKVDVVVFTVQSLILYQYPVDVLTFLELYFKSSNYLKMGKS